MKTHDPKLLEIRHKFYLRFYDPHRIPTRKTISLGTDDARLAEVKLRRRAIEYAMGAYDPWLESEEKDPSLQGAVRAFLGEKQHLKRSAYKSLVEVLLQLACAYPHVGVADLTEERVHNYVYRGGVAPRTVQRRLTTVRSFLTWCRRRGYTERNVAQDVMRPSVYENPPRFLTRSEYANILDLVSRMTGPKWKRHIVQLAVGTGIRLGGLLALTWRDVDFTEGLISVRVSKKYGYTVPLFPMARTALEALRPTDPRPDDLVLGPVPRMDTASGWFSDKVRDALRLPDDYTFHVLRHTFASWLVMAGVPLYTVSKWMGHSSIRVTERYAHLVPTTFAGMGSDVMR
jgi:integrase